MVYFILRRLGLVLITVLIVSIAVFLIVAAAPGNVARNVLGVHVTPAQEASFLAQMGLDKPLYLRYLYWLVGSDWQAQMHVGLPLRRVTSPEGFSEWWAVDKDGSLVRWKLVNSDLVAEYRLPDGSKREVTENDRWQVTDPAGEARRLRSYRQELAQNSQLADGERAAILGALDQTVEILERQGQTSPEMTAALTQTDRTLDALVGQTGPDPNADILKKAAVELGRDDLFQALTVFATLSDPARAASLQLGDLRAMSRRMTKAASLLQATQPVLATNLTQIAEQLNKGNASPAQDQAASMSSALREAAGPVIAFVESLDQVSYAQAAVALRELLPSGGPAANAFQRATAVRLLSSAAPLLREVSPDLGQALGQAADSLEADDDGGARAALGQAADALAALGQSAARNGAIQTARVGRSFWGVDTRDHAVLWRRGSDQPVWVLTPGVGWQATGGGSVEYIPLQMGLLRGDPGVSLRTGRPVSDTLFLRLRNSLILAFIAFVVVMPLALLLGVLAGLHEGRPADRILTVGGLIFTATPEFTTGIFLILIFASWLQWVPGATVFGEKAPWERPDMLILPILTLTLIELGYVLRITRASMVEVMRAPYIRTAFLKGLPFWYIVRKHALRNALMAPITVIMLHVNWLLGGIVIVEAIFGYPGLGNYLLDSALFKDTNAIEAGAMILVVVAVGTQLVADVLYTFLNPRIRYS